MHGSRNDVYSRKFVIDALHRLGYQELADQASRELPDPVAAGQLENWGIRHGISRDELVSQMGGSP